MKPRKTALSLLCAVALTLTLLVVPSSASGSLFFLSLNDTLPAQSTQTTPIQYNGWVYVPVNVFSSRTTGINFGVYYGGDGEWQLHSPLQPLRQEHHL